LYMSWVNAGGSRIENQLWTDIKTIDVRAYARLVCDVEEFEYRSRFTHDHCLVVNRDVTTGVYSYTPKICESRLPHLCIRDTVRYQVQSGRQCDVCGNSLRGSGFARPNATCFEQFPLADPRLFPFEHLVLQHYIDGTLESLITDDDADYNATYEFLMQSKTSVLLAYPGVAKLIRERLSTRENRLNPAGTLASENWLDFNLPGMYPVTCPQFCNRTTGICRRRCAFKQEYCEEDFPTSPTMALRSYPKFLAPIANTTDPFTSPTCGIQIHPKDYQPRNTEFLIVGTARDLIRLRAKRSYGTWSDLTRTFYTVVANRTTWVSGTVSLYCPTCGAPRFIVWVAPRNLFGVVMKTIVYNVSLSQLTTAYSVSFTLNTTAQVVGFDFEGLLPGATIGLGQFIVTDTELIGSCLNRNPGTQNWVEPQTSIDSGAPDNVCIFNDDQRRFYSAPVVGVCHCDKPTTGPDCDYPALPLPYARARPDITKAACGGFGATGNSLTGVAVIEEGVYFENNRALCKCRDVGRTIRSVMTVASAFADTFLERYDAVLSFTNLGVSAVLAATASFRCAAIGTILPSWITSFDLERFLEAWDGTSDVPVDVLYTGSVLSWGARAVAIPGVATPIINDQCPGTEICRALNLQNAVYNPSDILTDGDVTVYTNLNAATRVFTTLRPLSSPWVVHIWTADFLFGATVSGCTLDAPVFGLSYRVFSCTSNNATSVSFTTVAPSTSVSEVRAYEITI
jgi:hypothetical protein